MVLTLDLAPAVTLQRHLATGAFYTGLLIYLEAIVALVLLTGGALAPLMLVPVAPLVATQAVLARRPLRLLTSGRLRRSYALVLLGGAVYVALVALGTSGGERMAAVLLATLVVVGPAWPVIRVIRKTSGAGRMLREVVDPRVLEECMAFSARTQIAARVRSFGSPGRWAAPFAAALAAFGISAAILIVVLTTLGLRVNAAVAQVSTVVALWTFYRVMRHAKPSASVLKARDTRPPALILREFRDDGLTTAWNRLGRTFEHLLAGELDRIGPAISVGKPGEALAPLGASRDYLADPDWKRAVARLIDDAGVVVFMLGRSDSIDWELRTAIAARGVDRLLIVVPPLSDRLEVERRWAAFVKASVEVMAARLPREMPRQPVRALLFAGDDAIVLTGVTPARRSSWYARALIDYRIAVRVFGCLLREKPVSGADVERFVRSRLPMVEVRSESPGPQATKPTVQPSGRN